MAQTTTIRIASETRDRLNDLARRLGQPAGAVVDGLVREADDRALLESAAEGWQRIGSDSAALSAYRDETRDLSGFDSRLPEY